MENENNESMQLIISEIKEQPAITFNYEQLKNTLTEKLEVYKNIVYTEDKIKDAKEDRAKLNKLNKALDDEKKRIKNLVLKPYTDFENKVKELIGLVDESSSTIDTQVKAFEDKAKNEKSQEIIKYFDEKNTDYKELIDFDKIFKNEWLNKTFAINKVQQEIDHILVRTKTDLECLESSFEDKVILQQAKQFYFTNIGQATVLSMTMQYVAEIKDFNKKVKDTEQVSKQVSEQVQMSDTQSDTQGDTKKVGRVFKLICTQEQLIKLNEFLQSGDYFVELLERFEIK